ncbi:lipase family protein [Roseateles violae]|uniref:Lipase family protein n=1 Tax=Roseateles violae TaxID=3058042 RepID=A0ABT8DXU4_9BURK|nr:lipase family protein [Pelomonas sp. PFR6]MDN3922440.1 lipase family protein [Pelomonas sp. PFR6]
MPQIPYDASRKALFHPEARETLFAQGLATGDEVQLALEAARLAYYRYDEEAEQLERLAQALALAGFGRPELFSHADSDGQGYGCVNAEGLGLLAFRGTQPDHVGDLVSDVRFVLKPWELGRGKVHAGFRHTALGLWPEVQRWLAAARPQRLIVCGHSLGAAIATLLALPAGAQRLVTLGSPRVGDADFAADLEASSLEPLRVVGCCDVVTELPPAGLDFRHVGADFVYIDRAGQRHASPSAELIDADRQAARHAYLGEQAFRLGTVLIRDLADHAPINYLRAFWP